LKLTAHVDGEISIEGNTNGLHFDIPGMVAYVSHICRLNKGDLLALGDPGYADVFLDEAETVSCSIESIGTLSNEIQRVEAPEAPFR